MVTTRAATEEQGTKDGVTRRPMRKDGTYPYQGVVRIHGLRAISKTFDTYEEARKFVESVRSDRTRALRARRLRRQKQADIAAGSTAEQRKRELKGLFFKDAIREFEHSGEATERVLSNLQTVKLAVGDIRIGELSVAWTKSYIAQMRARPTTRGPGYSFATLKDHFVIMRKAIAYQANLRDTPLPRMPFSTTLFPRDWDIERDRRIEPGEEEAILAKLRSLRGDAKIFWESLFVLAVETAARLQELTKSEWREFDLQAREWRIPAIHTKMRKARIVPLSRAAVRALFVLQTLAKPDEPRLFHCFKDSAVASALWNRFIQKQAGIEGLRLHDLRHESTSRMVTRPPLPGHKQPSLAKIMQVTGHSDYKSFLRYLNLRGGDFEDMLD